MSIRMQPWEILICIIALAFAIRSPHLAHLRPDVASLAALPDQVEYLECGRNLLHGNGLSFVDPRFGQTVHAYRMPGYPLLIAACGGNISAIRFVQLMLDTSTVLAVYLLAQRWLSGGAALFAALIIAVNPFQIYFCGLILSETLFIALLIWSMTILLLPVLGERAGERASARPATDDETTFTAKRPSPQPSPRVQGEGGSNFSSLLVCVSTLVRPSATLLPIVLAVLAPSHRVRQVAGTILIEAVLLSVWAYRNHTVVGEWIVTTTNSGISAYDGLHPGASGASDQTFIANMPELKSMTETERNRYLADKANDFVKAKPLEVARLAIIKLARLWSPIPLSAEYGTNLKLIAIACVFMIPLYLLTLVGIFFGTIPRRIKLFLLAPALYFSLVHAVGVGSLRYRIPADVPMTIIAASGAAVLIGNRKLYGQPSADTGKTF